MSNLTIEEYAKKHPKTKSANIKSEVWDKLEKLRAGAKVLDVGCASGHTLNEIEKIFPSKFDLYGIDLSEIRIGEAKTNFNNIEFVVGSAQQIPYSDNYFDVVLSSQVIEHVPDDKKMAQEIKRVLKKGGLFQVDTVIKKTFGWYFYRSPIGWALDPTHLREYSSPEELSKIFTEAKLNISKIYLDRVIRPLNILPSLSFLDSKYKLVIPRYFTIFAIGRK